MSYSRNEELEFFLEVLQIFDKLSEIESFEEAYEWVLSNLKGMNASPTISIRCDKFATQILTDFRSCRTPLLLDATINFYTRLICSKIEAPDQQPEPIIFHWPTHRAAPNLTPTFERLPLMATSPLILQ